MALTFGNNPGRRRYERRVCVGRKAIAALLHVPMIGAWGFEAIGVCGADEDQDVDMVEATREYAKIAMKKSTSTNMKMTG
jgi:hypothetical protein